jgi:hypothetical protein
MALGFYFNPGSFTPALYDEAVSPLEAAGAGAPGGRLYHVALETHGEIQVFDVWDSQEAFDPFGERCCRSCRSRPAAGFHSAQHHQGLSQPARPPAASDLLSGVGSSFGLAWSPDAASSLHSVRR